MSSAPILITGSLAFDTLLHISGKLADRLPSQHQQAEGAFSAAYLAPHLSRALGGCAGNIAYALHKLGEPPQIVATAGKDFAPYAATLRDLGIGTQHILVLEDFFTAQATMVTDEDNNQLIAFHPGATAEAHRQRLADLPPPALAIVSPNGKSGMLQHCRDLAAAQVPFIFDPGQAVGMFSGEELRECLTLAPYAIFNQSEFEIAQRASGIGREEAAKMLRALFITHSEDGSQVLADGGETQVHAPCVHLGETQDPTGCGDAYRAGILYGMRRGWAWQPMLNFAAIIAAVKATHNGGQGYALSLAAAAEAYDSTFHHPLPQ